MHGVERKVEKQEGEKDMWIKTKEGIFNTDQMSSIYESKDGGTRARDCSERRVLFLSENKVLEEIAEGLKFHRPYMEVD